MEDVDFVAEGRLLLQKKAPVDLGGVSDAEPDFVSEGRALLAGQAAPQSPYDNPLSRGNPELEGFFQENPGALNLTRRFQDLQSQGQLPPGVSLSFPQIGMKPTAEPSRPARLLDFPAPSPSYHEADPSALPSRQAAAELAAQQDPLVGQLLTRGRAAMQRASAPAQQQPPGILMSAARGAQQGFVGTLGRKLGIDAGAEALAETLTGRDFQSPSEFYGSMPEPAGLAAKTAQGIAHLGSDLPMYIAAFEMAAMILPSAAAGMGPAAIASLHAAKGALAGTAVGTWRELMRQAEAGEFDARAIVQAAMHEGTALGAVGPLGEMGSVAMKVPAEAAVFTLVGAMQENRQPTIDEFIQNLALMGALNVRGLAGEALQPINRARESWAAPDVRELIREGLADRRAAEPEARQAPDAEAPPESPEIPPAEPLGPPPAAPPPQAPPEGPRAVFKGWQEWPGRAPIPLYDVWTPGQQHPDTVAKKTLEERGIPHEEPPEPPPAAAPSAPTPPGPPAPVAPAGAAPEPPATPVNPKVLELQAELDAVTKRLAEREASPRKQDRYPEKLAPLRKRKAELERMLAEVSATSEPAAPAAPAAAASATPTGDTIRIWTENGHWFSETEGPGADAIRRAFGTTTIPTPFGDKVPAEEVIRRLQKLNPGSKIQLRDAPAAPAKPKPAKPKATPGGGQKAPPEDIRDGKALADYIASRGGIWEPRGNLSGELRDLNERYPMNPDDAGPAGTARRGKFGLVRKGGMTIREWAEHLAGIGYFKNDPDIAEDFLINEWLSGGTARPKSNLPAAAEPTDADWQASWEKEQQRVFATLEDGFRREGIDPQEGAQLYTEGARELLTEIDAKPGEVWIVEGAFPDGENVPLDVYRIVEIDGAPALSGPRGDLPLTFGVELSGIKLRGPDDPNWRPRGIEPPDPDADPDGSYLGMAEQKGRGFFDSMGDAENDIRARNDAKASPEERARRQALDNLQVGDSFVHKKNGKRFVVKSLAGLEYAELQDAATGKAKWFSTRGLFDTFAKEQALPGMEATAKGTVEGEVKQTQAEKDAAKRARDEEKGQGRLFNKGVASKDPDSRSMNEQLEAPDHAPAEAVEPSLRRAAGERMRDVDLGSPESISRRSDMLRQIEEVAYAPIRQRRMGGGMLGWFMFMQRTIGIKERKDISTALHEMGHAAQKILFPELKQPGFDYKGPGSSKIRAELKALGEALYGNQKPAGGYKSEGFAEFMRLWIEERATARKAAPAFSKAFEERLQRDEFGVRLGKIYDDIGARWERWRKAPSVARILSNIARHEVGRERVTLGRLYAGLADRDFVFYLRTLQMEGKLRGGLLSKARDLADGVNEGPMNPWTLVQLFRGWSGAAELALTEGVPNFTINRLLGTLIQQGRIKTGEGRTLKKGDDVGPAPTPHLDVEQRAKAQQLQKLEAMGLVKRKKNAAGEWRYQLTDTGQDAAHVKGYSKLYKGLAEILRPVADKPLPFYVDSAEAINSAVGKLALRAKRVLGGEDANRGLDSFNVYGIARRVADRFEQNVRMIRKQTMRAGKVLPSSEIEKRAEILVRRQTGITLADAREAIKDLESPEMKRAFDEVQDFRKQFLRMMVVEGMLSPRQYRAITTEVKAYFPLHRIIEEAAKSEARGGKSFERVGNLKRFRGSQRDIVNPVESLVRDTFLLTNAIKRHQVQRSIVDYVESNPGSGWIAEDVTKEGRGKQPIPLRDKEINEVIRKFLRKSGLDQDTIDEIPEDAYALFQQIWRPTFSEAKLPPNTIRLWKDGEPSYYQIDPELFSAMAGLDRRGAHMIVRMLGAPATLLRAGATLHPDFAVMNMFRDAFTAALFSPKGFIPGLDTAKGATSRIARDEMYFRWKASGASQAHLISMDQKYLQREIRKALEAPGMLQRIARRMKTPKGVVIDTPRSMFEAVQDISEITENATRLGLFRRDLKDSGMDDPTQDVIMRAASSARGSTIDFGRGGAMLDEYKRIVAFLNASIQGIDKTGRVIASSALTGDKRAAAQFAARAFLFVSAPSIVSYLLTRNDERYQGLDEFQKDLFWHFPVKDRLIRIPKPFLPGIIFGSTVERALRFADSHDPAILDAMTPALLDSLLPSFIPTFLAGAWENETNRRLYGNAPVESERDKGLDPELRRGPFTSETAKAAGPLLRRVPGFEDYSPKKTDNLIRSLTGGVGSRYVLPYVTDPIIRAVYSGTKTGERLGIGERKAFERQIDQLPVFRQFIVPKEIEGQGATNRFYDLVEKAEQTQRSWITRPDDQAKDDLRDPEKRKLILTHYAIGTTRDALAALNQQAREAITAGKRDEYLEVRQRIQGQIKQAQEKIDRLMADPEADRVLWMNHEAHRLRLEDGAERVGLSNRIKDFLEDRDFEGLGEWASRELSPEDFAWAKRYIAALLKDNKLGPADAIGRKIEKKYRLRVRDKASEMTREP